MTRPDDTKTSDVGREVVGRVSALVTEGVREISSAMITEKARSNPRRYCLPDEIWTCGACGKTSEFDCYGIEGRHSSGWDESCMLNAVKVTRPTPPSSESTAPASSEVSQSPSGISRDPGEPDDAA